MKMTAGKLEDVDLPDDALRRSIVAEVSGIF